MKAQLEMKPYSVLQNECMTLPERMKNGKNRPPPYCNNKKNVINALLTYSSSAYGAHDASHQSEEPVSTSDNDLRILPNELRRIIDKNLSERDHRSLSSTHTFEKNRKSELPNHERYCFKEINDIGVMAPSNMSLAFQQNPMFRNMNFTGQHAFVKAILLQALRTQTLTFNINQTNFQKSQIDTDRDTQCYD